MSSPADPVTARLAEIRSTRDASNAATRTAHEQSTREANAAGAAVNAKARSMLVALRRRAEDRRTSWGSALEDELVIDVPEDDEPTVGSVVLPRPAHPDDDELEGRDWLR